MMNILKSWKNIEIENWAPFLKFWFATRICIQKICRLAILIDWSLNITKEFPNFEFWLVPEFPLSSVSYWSWNFWNSFEIFSPVFFTNWGFFKKKTIWPSRILILTLMNLNVLLIYKYDPAAFAIFWANKTAMAAEHNICSDPLEGGGLYTQLGFFFCSVNFRRSIYSS